MPKSWDQKRIAKLIEKLLELLDAADLDDTEADVVCNILVPKLLQRSGLDRCAFQSAAASVLLVHRAGTLPARH
jgi:hypothetical protein